MSTRNSDERLPDTTEEMWGKEIKTAWKIAEEKTKLVAWLESETKKKDEMIKELGIIFCESNKKKDERIKKLESVLAEIEEELKHKNKPWLA